MASPQVAGVIALMYAAMPQNMIQSYKNEPANFALKVKQSLLNGADSLASLDGLVASSRRLNAYGAIDKILKTDGIAAKRLPENTNLYLYPNPTTGELRIKNGKLSINSVEILDIFGKSIHTIHTLPKNRVRKVVRR